MWCYWCLYPNLKQTSLSEILFPDAKNSCIKKTNSNQRAKNVRTSKSRLFVTQHGEKARVRKLVTKKRTKQLNLGKLTASLNSKQGRKSHINSKPHPQLRSWGSVHSHFRDTFWTENVSDRLPLTDHKKGDCARDISTCLKVQIPSV